MPRSAHSRARLVALALAGVLFAAYPTVRPYSDETTRSGAEAVASSAWIASHTFAMLAFVLIAVGLPVLGRWAPTDRGAGTAPLLAWLGAGLVLPYYGAETFGLHAIARQAIATGDLELLRLFDTVRYQPVALAFFGVGLVLLAVAGVLVARCLWRAAAALRWGGLLLAAGLVGFLPQFFLPAPLRIAHGIVLALGCVVLAVSGWRRADQVTGWPPVTASISAVM